MKRLFLVGSLLAVSVLALVTNGTTQAQSTTQTTTNQTQSSGSIIWDGLWSGHNFDFSNLGFPASPRQSPTTSPSPDATRTYAALGDSVAAGLGLPGMSTPTGTDTRCGRSTQSYAYAVASSTNMPLLHVACSGAKVGDLFTKQAVEGPNITAQLDSAYASGTPELITITAGANDAHWDEFIRGCYAANCSNRATTLLANGYLVSLRTKLHVALTAIAERSNNKPPQVILTGYYNPLSATCTQYQSNITASEIAWLTSETDALNKTIQNVVKKYPFASFAPVDFTGHDICSGDSWVQGLTDPAPFHPTAQGQQAIAQSVLRAVN